MPFTLTPATAFERGARARWRVAVEVRLGGDAVPPRPAEVGAGPGRADGPRGAPARGAAGIGGPDMAPAACRRGVFASGRAGFATVRVVADVGGAPVFLVVFAVALPADFRPIAFAAAAPFFDGLTAPAFFAGFVAFAGFTAFDGLVALVGFAGFTAFAAFAGLAAFAGFAGFTAFDGLAVFAGLAGFTDFGGLVAFTGFLAAAAFFAAAAFLAVALPIREVAASVTAAAALSFFAFAVETSLLLRPSLAAFFFAMRLDLPAMVSLSLQ